MKVLLRLLPLLIKYKKWLWGSIISNVFFSIFTVVSIPLIIPFFKILFGEDNLQPDTKASKPEIMLHDYFSTLVGSVGKDQALIYVCIALVSVFLLKNLFRYLALAFMAPVRNGIVKDLRQMLHEKFLDLPLDFYAEERKGDLISRATADVLEVEWSILNVIEAIFKAPIIMIACIAFMIYVSPSLTGFVLILITFSAIVVGGLSKTLRKSSNKIQSTIGALTSTLEESINGIRIIKAYSAEKFQITKFNKLNTEFFQEINRLMFRRELSVPISEFLGVTMVIILLWYGARMVFAGTLLPTTFFAFIFAFYQVIEPSKLFSNAYYNILKGGAALDRIYSVLDMKILIQDKPNRGLEKLNFENKVSFNNVSFQYPNSPTLALENVTFTINKGELIALVGPSGGGKSTIVDLLLRMYDPTHGTITIDGVDIRNLSLFQLRSYFGVVTQEAILFNDTIKNNITLGSDHATEEDISLAIEQAAAKKFIYETENGLDNKVGDKGMKLSGGQKQRLTIARALIRNPDILLLDEATSALDSESELAIQQALDKAMTQKTSLVIAHRLSTIKNANRILVLDQGRIIEIGTHQDLLIKNGIYKSLIEMQALGMT